MLHMSCYIFLLVDLTNGTGCFRKTLTKYIICPKKRLGLLINLKIKYTQLFFIFLHLSIYFKLR